MNISKARYFFIKVRNFKVPDYRKGHLDCLKEDSHAKKIKVFTSRKEQRRA
jgi:hypothetical protein